MTSQKERRSKRVPVKHRLLLTILGRGGNEVIKEIVVTAELSQHGARIQGRRTLQSEWRGMLVDLHSGRQVPFRVAWQSKASSGHGYDAGVEFLADFDFWGKLYSDALASEAPVAAPVEHAESSEQLLREMLKSPELQKQKPGQFLEALLCNLVEQLEERRVFTRAELVAWLKKIGQP